MGDQSPIDILNKTLMHGMGPEFKRKALRVAPLGLFCLQIKKLWIVPPRFRRLPTDVAEH